MLQQILKDMYIDPALLTELDEEQKQLLFFKMREEQIRRWKEWESTHTEDEKRCPFKSTKPKKSSGKKKVDFLTAKDGSLWTWVMGEHPADRSVESIIEEEARECALKIAEAELREQNKKDSVDQGHVNTSKAPAKVDVVRESPPETIEDMSAYKALMRVSKQFSQIPDRPAGGDNSTADASVNERMKRRSVEIFHTLMVARDEVVKQSNEEEQQITEAWLEQERVAKQLEEEKKALARTIIARYKESLRKIRTESQVITALSLEPTDNASATPKTSPRTPGPENIQAAIRWFREEEEPKGAGIDSKTKCVAEWFHGVITREAAEELLSDKPSGSFLVRVSERIWGYAISYCSDMTVGVARGGSASRYKHFLVDTSEGRGYQLFGANHIIHESLSGLVRYHTSTPISFTGQEFLKHPCGQKKGSCDYKDLFSTAPADAKSMGKLKITEDTDVSHL